MSGATDGDGIFYLTTGDPISPAAESANQASSIQHAFDQRSLLSYRWPTAAERTAQQGMKPGALGMQVDNATLYLYANNNFGWRPITWGSSRSISGSTTIAVTGSGTSYSGTSNIVFPVGYFSTVPFIQVQAYTAHPEAVFASPTTPSTAGFTAVLKRTDSSATTVFWTATQN